MLEHPEITGAFNLNCLSFTEDTYWSTAVTLIVELHIFTIFGNHALCFLLQFAIWIRVEFKMCHGVKQLGEVSEIQPQVSYILNVIIQEYAVNLILYTELLDKLIGTVNNELSP